MGQENSTNSLIIGEIFKYLSVEDIFRFIQINKFFYFEWINDFGYALNLKNRLIERFGWRPFYSREDYNIMELFRFIIKKMEKEPTCACIGTCMQSKSMLNCMHLVPKTISRQTLCERCFKPDNKYISLNLAPDKHLQLLGDKVGKRIYHVKENRTRLKNRIYNGRNDYVFRNYIPVKYIEEQVEEDIKNLELYERRSTKKIKNGERF